MTRIKTPYRARGRFLGRYEFLCPFCGHHAPYRLQVGQWKITCKGESCRKVIGLGTFAYDLSGCRGKYPVPADVTMPTIAVLRYHKGDPLTLVVDAPITP